MIFGLPITTVAVVTGVPAVLAVLLIWWGIAYRSTEHDEPRTGEGKRS
jgi:hypothetical protein